MLVKDCMKSLKWYSQQAFATAAALQGAWVFLPDDLKSRAPDDLVNWITLAIVTLGFIGRLVPQGGE